MADGQIKVLLVDDSRLTRMSLKTTLSKASEQLLLVGEAEEGREAIQLIEKLKPDVVLMDIGMPVMDGIKATQLIRQQFNQMKIIILTSHESEEDILEAFRAGASSYCLKETEPELLLNIIRSTVEGACWIDPKIARVVVQGLQPAVGIASITLTDQEPSMYSLLTERERDVLKLVTEGKNNQEISNQLCISLNTVKTHLKNLFQKLEVEDRTAAALKALRERII